MPALPATVIETAEHVETIEPQFRRHEADWVAGTRALSSATQIINHPAFRQIVSMGECVIPFMLRDLETRPRLWVWALAEIAGINPVTAEDSGNIAKMSATWLRWAREKGWQW
ncbi:MAG: hypothetical protein EXS16_04180 [Gemmataceae bacterium]|nr:hypothetical protein [Gemmataceae bacterium]